MIRIRMLAAILGLTVILACSSQAGTEPNDANIPLTFEIGSTELPLSGFVRERTAVRRSPWKGNIAYAAGIAYTREVANPSGSSKAMGLFKSYALRQGISEEQQRFLDAMSINVQGRGDDRIYTPPGDPNSRQILLHAVSLEDAKKIAQAFVQYTQDQFNREVADHQAHIQKTVETVAEMQQRLSDLAQSKETTGKALEEVKKQVPYRSVQQALDAAGELDKLLNTAQVEMAGIQATLKAVQDRMKPMASAGLALDMKERLEMMFMEQSILLKAAEARKRMATELRKQADTYMDLMEALPRITGERELLARSLADESRNLQKMQAAHPWLLEAEPKTVDNRVFIYPIKN
jgi:hypothetical protein